MLESLDSGKPVSAIRRQDLPAVIDTLVYYADMADKINGQVIPARTDALSLHGARASRRRRRIIPWNFPLMIGMWKMAPALACGCALVVQDRRKLRHSPRSRSVNLPAKAFPAGTLNVVPGFGKVAGQALVDHPDVDKVTFTGSPTVGRGTVRVRRAI